MSVRFVMLGVLSAMLPGVIVQVWQFGPAVLVQLLLACATALLAEALALRLRGRAVRPVLGDGSALVTAALLAVSIPPLLPCGLTVFAVIFAIVIAKQLYGGLGYNPYNPAMVAYAALLVSFPRAMSQWLPPSAWGADSLSIAEAAFAIFRGSLPPGVTVEAMTGATVLSSLKTGQWLTQGVGQTQFGPPFGAFAAQGWEWVNLAYLAGGLWLWRRGLIAAAIPFAFVGVLFASSGVAHVLDRAAYPSPLVHLFSGGTMLGAFFVATDPVTAATSPKARWIYGGAIGLSVFVIRSFGGYPDGIAFAILLMNLAAPSLDYWCCRRPAVGER